MQAEIVSVGTEILLGQITDTNAARLGRTLAEYGISHRWRQTVGDNLDRLTDALKLALSRSDIVFTIGGLGPTEDDLTRDGIARALGVELVHDDGIEQHLRAFFAERNREYLASQNRQAQRPEGAEILENPNGTAPGLWCERDGKIIVAMPGPRGEFGPMLDGPVAKRLAPLSGDQVIQSTVVKIAGMGESVVEERIRHLLKSDNPTIAPYAKTGEVHLRITASADSRDAAKGLIEPTVEKIRAELTGFVYGQDDETLASSVVDLLRERELMLAVAESCTGGGLGAMITAVSGSSDVFHGGIISYSNDVKMKLLGVSQGTLDKHGAVSPQCAEEMALGAAKATGADCALSITGVAGPGGGTKEKPVGLVYIGCAVRGRVEVEKNLFPGTRDTVRERSAISALTLLRQMLA